MKPIKIDQTPAVLKPYLIERPEGDLMVEYSTFIPPVMLANLPCHARMQIKKAGTNDVLWEEHYAGDNTNENIKRKVKHIKQNLKQYLPDG